MVARTSTHTRHTPYHAAGHESRVGPNTTRSLILMLVMMIGGRSSRIQRAATLNCWDLTSQRMPIQYPSDSPQEDEART